jgi:hypothetical protein
MRVAARSTADFDFCTWDSLSYLRRNLTDPIIGTVNPRVKSQ